MVFGVNLTVAFSDIFIVIAIVALLALIPAALLSRSQQQVPRPHETVAGGATTFGLLQEVAFPASAWRSASRRAGALPPRADNHS